MVTELPLPVGRGGGGTWAPPHGGGGECPTYVGTIKVQLGTILI